MMRIHKEIAETLLMALVYTRDGSGDDPNTLRSYMVQEWCRYRAGRNHHTEPLVDLIDTIINERRNAEDPATLTEVVNGMADQLQYTYRGEQDGSGSHDKDLIDTMVRYLQFPFARGQMDADSLKRLRKAILIPEELTVLKAKLERQEQSCGGCGHRFASGEMASIMFGTREGMPSLRCTNCFTPEKMACSAKVGHSIPTPKNLSKTLEKAREKCAMCEEQSSEAVDPPAIQAGTRTLETLVGSASISSRLREAAAAARTLDTPPPAPPTPFRRHIFNDDPPELRGQDLGQGRGQPEPFFFSSMLTPSGASPAPTLSQQWLAADGTRITPATPPYILTDRQDQDLDDDDGDDYFEPEFDEGDE